MTKTKDLLLPLSIGIILIVGMLILVANRENAAETTPVTEVTSGYFNTVCLDGVLYWHQYRKLAVYIDKETLTPKRCETILEE